METIVRPVPAVKCDRHIPWNYNLISEKEEKSVNDNLLFRLQAHASTETQLPYNCQANSMITCFHSYTHTHTVAGNFALQKGKK